MMYYSEINEKYLEVKPEVELYSTMCECFDIIMDNYDINKEEIIELARNTTPDFYVELTDGVFQLNISFDGHIYTLGEVPDGLSENETDMESLKATVAAIILFDRAFPKDKDKHPIRKLDTLNLYHDLIKEYKEDN